MIIRIASFNEWLLENWNNNCSRTSEDEGYDGMDDG